MEKEAWASLLVEEAAHRLELMELLVLAVEKVGLEKENKKEDDMEGWAYQFVQPAR